MGLLGDFTAYVDNLKRRGANTLADLATNPLGLLSRNLSAFSESLPAAPDSVMPSGSGLLNRPGFQQWGMDVALNAPMGIVGAITPGKLNKGLLGDAGYMYHATNVERLYDIAESGKLKTHKPWEFTDQSMWPDGSIEKRSYFGQSPENLYQFAPESGLPAVLRVRADKARFSKEKSTGDVFTTKPINAKDIEYMDDEGKWLPLLKLINSRE